MILSVYNSQIYKEYFLPNKKDVDYTLILEKDIFGLKDNVNLKMENTKDGWKILKISGYELSCDSEHCDSVQITKESIINIKTIKGEKLQIFAADVQPVFHVLKKYDLAGKKEISIGKAEHNIIMYDFHQLVSSSHAVIRLHTDGYYIEDLSTNGIFESSMRIRQSKRLNFGDHINIFGLHILFLNDRIAIGSNYGNLKVKAGFLNEIKPVDYGELKQDNENDKEVPDYFKRSPRNLPEICSDAVEIEAPPAPKNVKKRPLIMTIGPSFTMAIPMLLGCGMAIFSSISQGRQAGAFMFTGIITAISSAIIGVIWALVNIKYTQKENEEEEQQRFNAYSNYLINIADLLKEKYEQNTRALNQIYPSAKENVSYGRENSSLWNRNINHSDFLFYRLGIGDIPFQMKISTPKEKFNLIDDTLSEKPAMLLNEYKMLKNVPVGINLAEKRLIGMVGGKNKKGAIELMHTLVAGIAANNCYTDVKMAFIYKSANDGFDSQWECMKWFPHVWSEDHQTRYIASNEIEAGDVFFELANIIRMRDQYSRNDSVKRRIKPHYVLFISDPSLIEGELLSKYILEPDERYGLTTFLMVETVEQLPNVCEDVLQNDEYFKGYCNLMDMSLKKEKMTFDYITFGQLEQMGRRLADIVVNEEESTSEIPSSLDFFEMYGVHKLDELNVTDRWRKNRTYNSMKALIGKKAGNADCYLDIHEKYHGPHGLIAGTTGSGKSETLQTYILSMALNFSPDDVSFFIIDYKGGGMADLFSDLPHMVGQISNLSGNQVRRAMISIKSENTRRQRLFKEYGVNNINLYTRLYKNGETKTAIPHLFIIIDEFAELKREEPDFMRELISVAQVGRSLGVHLILATQKPSGTVDDNIWSNSKFRLCLRVQDRQDSNDMLHKPDAAFITQAGRCYLQVGNDEIYELFQSGWSGAVYSEEYTGDQITAAILTRTGKPAVVGNFHKRNHQVQRLITGNKVKEKTQLEAIVEYLKQIAVENDYKQSMQLWLPVLKNKIYLDDVCKDLYSGFNVNNSWERYSGKWSLDVYPGIYDDPVNQAQEPLKVSFSDEGHLAVCGTVVSGKSTFLQTIVYSLINRYSPDDVNIYCLDFSSKMMAPFEKAPHVGGVIFDDETDRVGKFFHMILDMLSQRKKLFRGGNYSQYVQAYGLKLPAIVIVIDNYANFRDKTENTYESAMLTLAKEGVGHGIFLVISGSGFSMAEIPGRIADNMRNVITLEMGDKFKYIETLKITHLQVYPETGVKGRGLAVMGDRVLEFQTALCLEAEDDFERSEKIEKLCKRMSVIWQGKTAKGIPFIPEQPVLSDLTVLESYEKSINDKRLLPIGYCREDASVYNVRLNYTYCYTVSGKAHTGRTNVLKLFIYSAMDKQADICIIEPNDIRLSRIAGENNLTYIKDSKELFNYFNKLTPEFVKRNKLKHELEEKGLDEEEIFDEMAKQKPIFIVISDLLHFFNMVYKPQEGVGNISGFTETIIEKGRLHNIYLVGAVKPDDSPSAAGYKGYNLFTGYKTGMHLGGNYSAQRIFNFQNIPYQQLGKMLKRGIGAAADEEDETIAIEVVLPLAKKQI